jgi:hypothetical protein
MAGHRNEVFGNPLIPAQAGIQADVGAVLSELNRMC